MSSPQFPPGSPVPPSPATSVPSAPVGVAPGRAPVQQQAQQPRQPWPQQVPHARQPSYGGPQPHPQYAGPSSSGQRPPRARRITGVDVARSIAIVGMLVAHLGTGHDSRGGGWGEQWMWIFDGRSSALFATLAGVSLALMSRSTAREDRLGWRRLRVKIAVRAAILLVLGVVLQVLGTPVVVILTAYAVMFLMALPVLRLASRWLLLLAGVAVVLGPVVVLGLRQALTGSVQPSVVFSFEGPVVGELVTGYYPALVWIGYLLVGVVVGRGALASRRYAAILLGGGTALAAIAYGLGTVLTAAVGRGLYPVDVLFWPDALLSVEPHANSSFEVAGNIGVALAVIGLCLLLTSVRTGELALSPLAALGAMSLTIYSVQLVVIAVLGQDAVYYPGSNGPLIALTLASIAFAWGWRAVLGQGPLERLLKISSDSAASAMVPAAPTWPR